MPKSDEYKTPKWWILKKPYICKVIIILCAAYACFNIYKIGANFLYSLKRPVRSEISREEEYLKPPAIVIYPIGAKFQSCGNFEGVVTSSKAHVHDLELTTLNCQFTNLSYKDPFLTDRQYPVVAIVIRGPTNYSAKEVLYTHFQLNDEKRNFAVINFMIFENYDDFANESEEEQVKRLLYYHKNKAAFSLSAGLRQWVKFSLVITEVSPNHVDSQFLLQQSLANYYETEDGEINMTGINEHTRLFFTFFEWESNLIRESKLMYTTTVWSVIASLCSILLALHKAYQIASMSFHSVKVSRRKRKQSKVLKAQLSLSSTMACDLETGRVTTNSLDESGLSKIKDCSVEDKNKNVKLKRALFRESH